LIALLPPKPAARNRTAIASAARPVSPVSETVLISTSSFLVDLNGELLMWRQVLGLRRQVEIEAGRQRETRCRKCRRSGAPQHQCAAPFSLAKVLARLPADHHGQLPSYFPVVDHCFAGP
jgi:hypothetical protein